MSYHKLNIHIASGILPCNLICKVLTFKTGNVLWGFHFCKVLHLGPLFFLLFLGNAEITVVFCIITDFVRHTFLDIKRRIILFHFPFLFLLLKIPDLGI